MRQGPEARSFRPKEKETTQEGVRINFSNPEVLRAYILDLQNSGRPSTLAEIMSGIREIPLGGFTLDGQLFKSANFSLVVEPDPNPRTQVGRPTVIIRADIKLGDKYSKLKDWQFGRIGETLSGSKKEPEESEYFLHTFPFEKGEKDMEFIEYSKNTARIHRQNLDKESWPKSPLVVLQIWDKDTRVDDIISISVFSNGRYSEDWSDRHSENSAKEKEGWEVDSDDVDRWKFNNRVGIDVYDAEVFKDAITFYEAAFSEIMRSLYKAEGVDMPNLLHKIELPMAFEGKKEIIFKDIGGQEEAIQRLRSRVSLMKSIHTKIHGANTPFLLYGLPGNGKTSLVEATASELGAPLIVKTTQDLPSTANDSDFINLLEAGFLEAKAAAKLGGGKSVYCIEQIEALIGDNLRLQDRVLNLMNHWADDPDGNVLVIATSNFPQKLHLGIISRFEAISVEHPNEEGRLEILEIHKHKINASLGRDIFTNVDFNRIVRRLDGFSGRDIEKFLKTAYFLARLESREKGQEISIDTEFVLNLVPDNRVGFKTS